MRLNYDCIALLFIFIFLIHSNSLVFDYRGLCQGFRSFISHCTLPSFWNCSLHDDNASSSLPLSFIPIPYSLLPPATVAFYFILWNSVTSPVMYVYWLIDWLIDEWMIRDVAFELLNKSIIFCMYYFCLTMLGCDCILQRLREISSRQMESSFLQALPFNDYQASHYVNLLVAFPSSYWREEDRDKIYE